MKQQSKYKLAIRWNFLTRYYDFLVANLMREKRFKNLLIEQFQNKNPNNILDVGCGTGTLTIQMKKHYPEARLVGLDGDDNILKIAKQKFQAENLSIDLQKGLASQMPFPDSIFDVVTCSIMLHHLNDEDKIKTLKESRRVLKDGGEVNIADWGKASNSLMRLLFHIIQLLDGYDTTNSNVKGCIPEFIRQSGFREVRETAKVDTVLGTISTYQGIK
jgi:ubiquinone/menaquinone biosynthesis C-methylase UbiE